MVKDFQHKNYWALVLGGSSGLGLASAQKLARHGMHICVVHRDRKSQMPVVEEAFDQIRAEGVQFISFNLDAMRADKRTMVLETLQEAVGPDGKVRTLLHSIAKGNLKPMLADNDPELQNDDFHLTLEAMAFSLYDWVKSLHQAKLFAEDARVTSFTSMGNQRAWAYYAAVSAAKAALEAITRSIALEFAPFGIRANCIQAGVTDTPSLRLIPGNEQLKKHGLERNPQKRLTKPQDVANVVYLLSKDEAAWINGTIIPVDGGEHLV